MEIMKQQKQQIVELQVECATLKNMVLELANIHNMAFSMTQLSIGSSGNKEDETIQ